MHDGSTPSPATAPFAVGYGNGYGYESVGDSIRDAGTGVRWGESAATAAMPLIDPDATQAMAAPVATVAPVAAAAVPAPFVARPVGAAHPRRRFGRGLVRGSPSSSPVPASAPWPSARVPSSIPSAAVSASGRPAADAMATVIGDQVGHGVDPATGAPTTLVPASLIESPTLTRVPPTVVPTTTPPTVPPTTPPTSPPPTTTPPTTAPPTTTPPTTTPTGPTFATLNVPATATCPNPADDASVSFSWSAPGATKVTLSIDGPGIYRTYPGASGSETVNFPCSSSHTYLFTAYGSGNVVTTASFTVTPA